MLTPPKSVPGPFRPTAQPPKVAAQRLPRLRYWTTTGGETLHGLAQAHYNNSRMAVDIFNANRVGKLREDNTSGFLTSVDQTLSTGLVLIIP